VNVPPPQPVATVLAVVPTPMGPMPREPPPVSRTPLPGAAMVDAHDPSTLRGPQHAYAPGVSSALPPPTSPVRRSIPSLDEESEAMRMRMRSAYDAEAYSMPRRRKVGGWIVGLVLLAGVGIVGWVVAKPYLAARQANGAAAALDPKTQAFLSDGEKAMADGNLDLAQENFDKASALAEKDPKVLLAEARLAAARADVPWLKLRVLQPDQTDEQRATKQQLDDRLPKLRKAVDDALAAAPDEPAAIRSKIDALRIAGEREAARGFVSRVIGQATQPETAYVLAALDLAETEPLWPTVLERLRLAASGEGNAGRARAALVYGLARSGDVVGAKAELGKLEALTRPYPLLSYLRVFVDKSKARPLGDGGAAAASGTPLASVSSLPMQGLPGGASDTRVPADSRVALAMAAHAERGGNLARARELYETVVARNPSDSEALSGLGDVSRAQGDLQGAIADYKRALTVNPSYLPALIGLADSCWAGGDRGTAIATYKQIVDRFPEGTYPGYVKQRAEGGAAPTPSATATATPTATATATSTAAPAATTTD
jgi:tetratricopeptide (TPR) repeat protein